MFLILFIRLFAVTMLGPSTTNANESIPDGAVNVNSETMALTCANSLPMLKIFKSK